MFCNMLVGICVCEHLFQKLFGNGRKYANWAVVFGV